MRGDSLDIVPNLRIHRPWDFSQRLQKQITAALVGDGTCSLANMNTTCFAAEFCNRRACMDGVMSMVRDSRMTLIATTPAMTPFHRRRFVGCVSAAPASSFADAFPQELTGHMQGSWVISNLCVSSAFRSQGVGKRLTSEIEKHLRKTEPILDIYICVLREECESQDVSHAMAQRVDRLLQTYSRMGYRYVCPTKRYHLFKVA